MLFIPYLLGLLSGYYDKINGQLAFYNVQYCEKRDNINLVQLMFLFLAYYYLNMHHHPPRTPHHSPLLTSTASSSLWRAFIILARHITFVPILSNKVYSVKSYPVSIFPSIYL